MQSHAMELKKDVWYVRLFLWSADIVGECSNWQGVDRSRRDAAYYLYHGAGQCVMIRTICLWMPFTLALHAIVYGLLFMALVGVPAYLFTWGYMWTVTALALFVAAVRGTIYLRDKHGARIGYAVTNTATLAMKPIDATIQSIRAPRFVTFLWQGMKDAKRKVCPLIKFVD